MTTPFSSFINVTCSVNSSDDSYIVNVTHVAFAVLALSCICFVALLACLKCASGILPIPYNKLSVSEENDKLTRMEIEEMENEKDVYEETTLSDMSNELDHDL